MSVDQVRKPAARRDRFRQELYERYRDRISINPALRRSLVSYQSNRKRPFYRWFKYKEGFSAGLVEYVLGTIGGKPGVLLDPFAGAGAAMFASREHGWDSRGIELLPAGIAAIEARLAAERVDRREFAHAIDRVSDGSWRADEDTSLAIRHLSITKGAFPEMTDRELTQFRTFIRDKVTNPDVKLLLNAACLSILESVSYTRKDGQYLRWDSRAPRNLPGKRFDKGPILAFDNALTSQLHAMHDDLNGSELFPSPGECPPGCVAIECGSCLRMLPQMAAG